ncbi:hypothetical protein DUNSADRAFT_18412, partial [Dunaliella salina]
LQSVLGHRSLVWVRGCKVCWVKGCEGCWVRGCKVCWVKGCKVCCRAVGAGMRHACVVDYKQCCVIGCKERLLRCWRQHEAHLRVWGKPNKEL